MISKFAIEERVREWGLREDVVEKDYVIGWVLWGIAADPLLGAQWAFKGGTCLKKCFIETYRFSEDLDYTVLPGGPIRPDDVLPLLLNVLGRVTEECGIDFGERAPIHKGHSSGNYTEGRVYYRGPRAAPMVASIRLDLSASERVIRSTVLRPIAHPYPDDLPEPRLVRCYAFEEIFAEKIRAMGERGRPRDLYDVINLFRRSDLRGEPADIHNLLVQKCHAKGVPVPTLAAIESSATRTELESEWANMLAHQLPALPPLDDFWEELPRLFAWLEGALVEAELPTVAVTAVPELEIGWAPSPTIATWGAGVPLETIRFAAANLLCIELGYNGSRRVIEPYSLRRTRAGHLLLYAVRADSREPRAYRVDRIESVRVTTRTYRPVYRVELSASGSLRAPELSRPRQPGAPRQRTRSVRHGLVYVVQCPYCHKTFKRKHAGATRLNEHKDTSGRRCPGSGHLGYVVESRYV